MENSQQRSAFVSTMVLLEGMLGVAGLGFGWLLGIDALAWMKWDLPSVLWGLVAALPPIAAIWVLDKLNLPGMERITRLLDETLGDRIIQLHWFDLALLSLMAGVGEEILFRGFLQALFERGGPVVGIVLASLVFGALHPITPTYVAIVTVMGLYLGALTYVGEGRNLMTPTVAHAFYDFLAFLFLRNQFRERRRLGLTGQEAENDGGTVEEPEEPAAGPERDSTDVNCSACAC